MRMAYNYYPHNSKDVNALSVLSKWHISIIHVIQKHIIIIQVIQMINKRYPHYPNGI